MPIAVYTTRYVASYELLDSGYAIPVAIGLGLVALAFARRARRETALRLGRTGAREGVARAGRQLGIVGLCVASAAIVALAVYELLEYAGTRG
jgi:hypothetical protein